MVGGAPVLAQALNLYETGSHLSTTEVRRFPLNLVSVLNIILVVLDCGEERQAVNYKDESRSRLSVVPFVNRNFVRHIRDDENDLLLIWVTQPRNTGLLIAETLDCPL